MEKPKLNNLPNLVLHQISSLLWNDSSVDLVAFASTSKACYEAAAPFTFKSLTITVSNRKQLCDDVQFLTAAFFGDGCREFLRRLRVEGTMPLLEQDVGQAFEEDELRRSEKKDLENLDEFPFRNFSRGLETFADPLGDPREEVIRAWSPLARLISSLRLLTDLIFGCTNQFPPNLLEALHQHHPSCRLNLPRFRFRSLGDDFTDPHELAIMTSPCLHSLGVRNVWMDSNGENDYNEEAVRHSIALAPNLQHLTLIDCMVLDTLDGILHAGSREPWRGFNPPIQVAQIASLRSLSLCGHRYFADPGLQRWRHHTDFSRLEVLVLAHVPDMEPLMHAALQNRFMSLQDLSINLLRGNNDNFQPHAEIFFRKLQPLNVLRLFGDFNVSMIDVIANRHGPTLRHLQITQLDPTHLESIESDILLKPQDILNLAGRCPLLEKLYMPIKRYKSGPQETQCYEALGNFPSLVSITLTLDCSEPYDPESSTTNVVTSCERRGIVRHGQELSNAEMQNAFINCAVDQTLALSIWAIISINTARNRPLMYLSITSLVKHSSFSENLSCDFSLRLSQMAGSYILKRSSKPGRHGYIEVIERFRKIREQTFEEAQRLRAGGVLTKREIRNLNEIQAAFEKVWPRKVGSVDWRDDWSSRRLQRSV